ncbi:hypothetical protein QAD02_008879 [Eretmocerus hayati]|uniref:Uncharacterized protein n=1 Tax=Eretmocerus hayati TaxID=131215 RepID=A0ACC2N7U5_9HYME|nr:hypothetical protein QAD02_008879 [Eretmocerus hayati]
MSTERAEAGSQHPGSHRRYRCALWWWQCPKLCIHGLWQPHCPSVSSILAVQYNTNHPEAFGRPRHRPSRISYDCVLIFIAAGMGSIYITGLRPETKRPRELKRCATGLFAPSDGQHVKPSEMRSNQLRCGR